MEFMSQINFRLTCMKYLGKVKTVSVIKKIKTNRFFVVVVVEFVVLAQLSFKLFLVLCLIYLNVSKSLLCLN